MKKEKLIVIIASCLVFTTAMANTEFGEKTQDAIDSGLEMILDFTEVPSELENENDKASVDTELVFNECQYADLVNTVMTMVDEENTDTAAIQMASFAEEYNMNAETIDKFKQWIAEGKDYRLLMYIYEFWLTTNEDIDMVGDAYDMFVRNYDEDIRLPSNKDLWFEGIFNSLTGNKYGTLTYDDVDNYMEAGLDIDEIKYAERASRAGRLTVTEILDEKVSGRTWSDITAQIYDMPEIQDMDELDVYSIQDVLTYSKITGESADEIFNKAEGSSTSEMLESYFLKKRQNAFQALKSEGIDLNFSEE